jgi:lipopolysaccharide biosynthesis regulator YciM
LKKQQLILVSSGVVLLCLIYFFGKTIPPKKNPGAVAAATGKKEISFTTILEASKQQLNPAQQAQIAQLETAIVRGDVKDQQVKVYKQLAAFWKDSAHLLLPYAYYSAQAAKLENSQKSLTFAAQFFLEGIRRQENPDLQRWMASEAKELFEKALQIAPDNDSLKIGLGSCYLLGNISESPMQGIMMIREVAEKDPENMYAQFMLGLGGMISGQFDKAIDRLLKVVQHQPENVEATLMLAEAYERQNDKANAVKWYQAGKKQIKNADVVKEIDERIKLLGNK